MDVIRKIGLIWEKVNVTQRILLVALLLAVGIGGTFLFTWAKQPDMRLLYQGLAPEEAAKIVDKITEKDIPYELRSGGSSIWVPQQYVYELRLEMAREGLPAGQQSGYKLFDNEKIGVSPFVQSVNLKRALEDELAKSIQMIEGVMHARVHIVTSDQGLFVSDKKNTTASVVLQIRPGYRLSPLNIAAITNMVAGSVSGLQPESVTIVDSQGRLLSSRSDHRFASGAGTVQDYRERVEQSLQKKAEDLLSAVLGPNRAAVSVSAVVDMNSVSTIIETPTEGVDKKEDKNTTDITKPQAGEGTTAVAEGEKTKETRNTTEYVNGKTVKQEVILPGEVISLSVAAFVDLYPADANETAGAQAALIMEVSEVEEIIRNALGLKGTDALKVVNTRFQNRPTVALEEESSNWPTYLAIARHASMGILALCALIALKIFAGARKKAAAVGVTPAAAMLPASAGGEATAMLAPSEAGGESVMLRRQIAHTLKSNPEQVRQLFASWIEQGSS